MNARRRRWPWLLLGLLALLGAAAATFPAALAWRWLLAARLDQIELNGLDGSVWQGRASELRVRGFSLGALGWQVRPRSLLELAPVVDLTLAGPDLRAAGALQRRRDASLVLRGLDATLAAKWLAPLLALPYLTLAGEVQIVVPELELDADGVPRAGKLDLYWRGGALGGISQGSFGDIVVSAQGQQRRWMGTISTAPGGPLQVDGGFTLVERTYHAEIVLRARDPADPLAQALRYVGQAQADGSQLLLIDGFLLPLGQPAP